MFRIEVEPDKLLLSQCACVFCYGYGFGLWMSSCRVLLAENATTECSINSTTTLVTFVFLFSFSLKIHPDENDGFSALQCGTFWRRRSSIMQLHNYIKLTSSEDRGKLEDWLYPSHFRVVLLGLVNVSTAGTCLFRVTGSLPSLELIIAREIRSSQFSRSPEANLTARAREMNLGLINHILFRVSH